MLILTIIGYSVFESFVYVYGCITNTGEGFFILMI